MQVYFHFGVILHIVLYYGHSFMCVCTCIYLMAQCFICRQCPPISACKTGLPILENELMTVGIPDLSDTGSAPIVGKLDYTLSR